MNDIYEGFEDWEDVQSYFEMKNAEPEQVLLAIYNQESDGGDALVVYRNGDKFYTVSGAHCSCYGLEGQWEPEEYDAETFSKLIERQLDEKYGSYGSYAKASWKLIKSRMPDHNSDLSK